MSNKVKTGGKDCYIIVVVSIIIVGEIKQASNVLLLDE